MQSCLAGVAGDGFTDVGHWRRDGDGFWNKRDALAASVQLQKKTPGWAGGHHSSLELSAVFPKNLLFQPSCLENRTYGGTGGFVHLGKRPKAVDADFRILGVLFPAGRVKLPNHPLCGMTGEDCGQGAQVRWEQWGWGGCAPKRKWRSSEGRNNSFEDYLKGQSSSSRIELLDFDP